jgi:lipopolysaccharide export system permease protein
LLEEPEETIALVLKRKQTLEFLSGENLLKLSVRDVQDQRLLGVVVKQRKATAKTWEDPDSVTRIHSAVLRVDQAARKVQLADHQQMETWVRPGDQSKAPQGSGSHSLEGKALEFDLPPQFSLESLRVENASNPGMLEWAKLPTAAAEAAALAARHDLYATRLAKLPAEPLTDAQVKAFHDEVGIHPAADPAVRLKQADDNRNHRDAFARRDRIMRYEYHLRPAIAGGCLLFVVLGCPVGLWANRADYLSIFVICFLPALLVYYPILFMVGGYARDGRLPMALGVWTANAALAVGTVVLAWRLIRR